MTITMRFRVTAWFLLLFVAPAAAAGAVLQVPAQYATIQAAVDAAAAGDEVLVAAGVYEEQVVITKNLTLTGAGRDLTVLRAPVFMPHVSRVVNYNAVVHAEAPATNVIVRDIGVDGAGRGRLGTRFVGVLFDDAGGEARRLDLVNLHETPAGTSISGIGLFVNAESVPGLHIVIDDIDVHTYQKSGLVVFGRHATYDISHVTVDAANLYTDAVQNGIELLNQTTGVLRHCTMRNARYDNDPIVDAASCGMLVYYAGIWELEDLVFENNQIGLYGIANDLTVRDVDIYSDPLIPNYNYGAVMTGNPSYTGLLQPEGAGGAYGHQGRPVVRASTGDLVGIASSESGSDCRLDDVRLHGASAPQSVGLASYSGLEELRLTVSNCLIQDWSLGAVISDTENGWLLARLSGCSIRGNKDLGVLSSTLRPVDARGNDWGALDGPYHPELNPGGTGDTVTDGTLFDPWLQGNVFCDPMPGYIGLQDFDGTGFGRDVTVRYLGGAAPIYGYSLELTWDTALLTAGPADVSRPGSGQFSDASLFLAMPLPNGLRIDAAVGGAQPGVTAGALCTVRFHALGQPDNVEIPIRLTVRELRDSQNADIGGGVAVDGAIIADLVAPRITDLQIINETLPHTNAFAKDGDQMRVKATVEDGDPLLNLGSMTGNFVYLVGADGWLIHPAAYEASEAVWPTLPASVYPKDGPLTVWVTATDRAGNSATASTGLTADNTPPLPPTNLAVTGAHNRIDLQWDDPAGLDANLRHVAVRSVRTGDYPAYAAPDPAYPASPAEGDSAYTGLGSAVSLEFAADGGERDIYWFQTFAVDVVDLASPIVTGTSGFAMNYKLGDVAAPGGGYDGACGIYDVSRLGDAFGLTAAAAAFDGECDLAPTSTGGVSGLPRPDGVVDINDLLLFAQLFSSSPDAPAAPLADDGGAGAPQLRWVRESELEWRLELAAPCPGLKGLRVSSALLPGGVPAVDAGELLQAQSAPYFLHTHRRRLDVNLAMLGAGVGVQGAGELLRLVTPRPVDDLHAVFDVRGLNGESLVVDAAPDQAWTPSAFSLAGNHPNPFNPSTRVVFDLPSPQHVRLTIYSLDGRRAGAPWNGRLPAGRHAVPWDGRDDAGRPVAAGVYLYRVEAGPWSAVGKMNLVR